MEAQVFVVDEILSWLISIIVTYPLQFLCIFARKFSVTYKKHQKAWTPKLISTKNIAILSAVKKTDDLCSDAAKHGPYRSPKAKGPISILPSTSSTLDSVDLLMRSVRVEINKSVHSAALSQLDSCWTSQSIITFRNYSSIIDLGTTDFHTPCLTPLWTSLVRNRRLVIHARDCWDCRAGKFFTIFCFCGLIRRESQHFTSHKSTRPSIKSQTNFPLHMFYKHSERTNKPSPWHVCVRLGTAQIMSD